MNLPTNVAIGDSTPVWLLGHIEDLTGEWVDLTPSYTCSLSVPGAAISRAVTIKTPDNNHFAVSLIASETAGLVQGQTYHVTAQIENAALVPPLRKEVTFPIFMIAGAIA